MLYIVVVGGTGVSPEFMNLLLEAGEWAKSITIRQASWNKDAGRLDIYLHSPRVLNNEQLFKLDYILKTHFQAFDIHLEVEQPLMQATQKREESQNTQKSKPIQKKPPVKKQPESGKLLLGRRIAQASSIPMRDVHEELGRVTIEGSLLSVETRSLKSVERVLLLLTVTDYTNTLQCKAFLSKKEANAFANAAAAIQKQGHRLLMRGVCEYDKFARDIVLRLEDVVELAGGLREDCAGQKRVELHMHTNMSAMDGLTNITEAVRRAADWGHPALAVTDHGVAQAFPEAYKAGKKHGVKILYGVEGYMVLDAEFLPMEQTYVVFDIETTGLKAEEGHILEIGAVKIQNEEIIDRFSTFIDSGAAIPPYIVQLTGITEDMLLGAPHTKEALQAFSAFAEGCVLVAHNAPFDVGFIRTHGRRYKIEFPQPYADTLMLSRYLLFGLKSHKLSTVCEHLSIPLHNHHRAMDDAEATAGMFLEFLRRIRALHIQAVPIVTPAIEKAMEGGTRRQKRYHIVLLARTQQGLHNLYRLISTSHLDFFHRKPLIPKSMLHLFREGMLLGSACEQGEIVQAVLHGKGEEELLRLADFYDYLEIQPLGNNAFLVREGTVKDEDGLKAINQRIVELGERLHKPVAATGDVHFLEPEHAIYRAIIMHKEGYKDAHLQAPLYYMSTEEMLAEFSYLGEEGAHKAVVDAPNAIAALCEDLKPYPDGTFAPRLPGAEEELAGIAVRQAHALYGEQLPEIVQHRLDKELHSIIDNGFASLYLVARRLVQKSLSDGYLVGSRGSVGSSLVATLLGITEVNPLPPHYVCPACRHSDFQVDRSRYACGVDMPRAQCPACGASYRKEGFDIPFEVFLGFHGDKTPDIDLNFSGEYQPVAHRFTEEMFGEGHAFRAGTISSIKKKTAYGYVQGYLEAHNISASRLEVERLCEGCTGVKRTTGQHPGGIVIVPEGNDILHFTPVQYPSDQREKGTITTHFDFHALDDRLVKLDILGHVDPTALRMLQDMTGVDPTGIPLDDENTLQLYSSSEPLQADLTALSGCDVGSIGLPEFGTGFVRQMLKDTRPTTMEELVRIAGLSHGTDVWLNNAQNLIRNGTATLSECICTRDDIMNYLISCGCDSSISFKAMENVRKGRGLTEDMRAEMLLHDVPGWYIESCEKIKYMFPRAHAVAYVMMSFRIAYYKMHYPKEYYAVYYTTRAETFDILRAIGGPESVLREIKAIRDQGKAASDVDLNLLTILEVVYEMNMRGIAMLPVDVYASHATEFLVQEGGIRAPFSALAGIGDAAAEGIAQNIKGERFLSIEDFQSKTGANSAAMAALTEAGCFESFPKTNQISMF